VLAFTVFFYDWAWNDAEEHFRRALALNPNSADTYWMYAQLVRVARQFVAYNPFNAQHHPSAGG